MDEALNYSEVFDHSAVKDASSPMKVAASSASAERVTIHEQERMAQPSRLNHAQESLVKLGEA
jgi:hypothetical protein